MDSSRHGDYKAIRSKQGEPLAIYDITQDIKESNDIAKQHPDVIARIETFLKKARSPSPHYPK